MMSNSNHFKDNSKNKSALSTRWAQMSKQEQIIEKKKMEIQNKLEAQKQAAALAAQVKLTNPSASEDKNSANIFSNDGSFMSHFKALLEKQKKDKDEKDQQQARDEEKVKNESINETSSDTSHEIGNEKIHGNEYSDYDQDERRQSDSRSSREKNRRWGERGRSPVTPVIEDRKNHGDNKSIPSLMQIPVMPPNDSSNPESTDHIEWTMHSEYSDSNRMTSDQDNLIPGPSGPMESSSGMGLPNMGSNSNMMMGHGGPNMPPMGPGGPNMPPMGPGGPNMPPMGPGGPNMPPMGPGGPNMPPMGPGGPNMPMPPFMGGPPNFGMPPNFMGPNGPCGPGPMPPNMCGPNGPMPPFFGPPFNPMMRPNGPPNSMIPPNGPPNSMMPPNCPPNSMMPPNGPPNSMMPPNGPPHSMMPPNGPPNSMMPPNGPPNSMMPPNGPPNSMMPPNGPPNSMMPPNGPPNSMMPPNSQPNSMMPSNGPPNSMMPPNRPMMPMNGPPNFRLNGPPNSMMHQNNGNMPFMGPRPPFGSGDNFGPNAPANMPFMPPNSLLPNHGMPEGKPRETMPMPPSDAMKLQNIPPPMPLPLNHIPKPKDLELGNIPAPNTNQVLSADAFPPPVQRAAADTARNGDHWENVLKAIQTQDQSLWFLHNTNSNEYKAFRELVLKIRSDLGAEKNHEVKPEDKYEPEFCLEDDDSYDEKPTMKEESGGESYQESYAHDGTAGVKREQPSSQSDDDADSKRERRKRNKKSRWSDEPPPADIKPPGVVAPLPLPVAGAKLAKIGEEGIKLTTINRRSQALMQYAMTNYGSTNLSAEDWKKCEDNFKLNLLYQDMMKKKQEVERLAAAGRHKYEYDSDEDTSEGTWEHKLRAKEMYATEKWATELTKQAAGKHHIGDFLPPEELKKFMEKYSAIKSGKEPDLSDYKEFKLGEDNVGFKMLQKLGWSEGQGLGSEGTGIVEPINKSNQPANLGLGAATSEVMSPDDDEFDAYRKRMMLAYRFRPNPLNNPRRPYY